MSHRSCCCTLPIVVDIAVAFRRIKWMGQPARGIVEAEATRMWDEPGLGRGGEGIVRPRPCRGVSDEAEDEWLVFHADSETTGTRT